ncbi:glycosyltransferase family 39 protein [Streptomyces sp. NPDC005423]|uniref:glycosyltransferase family 39 protein n=1 Tax=Streptomyces sp. NPDC005423 TaxID=3155343 RepID=UPI0033BA678A
MTSGVRRLRAPRRRARAVPVVPVAVPGGAALALGLWGIDRQDSMWRDESVTYQVAHRSLRELWRLLGRIDAVHGLYYLLMHAVFACWDGGLPALRLPSVVAASLAAAGVGAIGARLAGRRAGTLAGLVFAVLPLVQRYAQEGRSYALVTAGVTWATYLLLRAADARITAGSGRRWWTAYALTLGVSCWLHEFAALTLAAHGLTLWRLGVPKAVWRRWAVSATAVLAALVPLVVASAGQADEQLGWLGPPGPAAWLQFLATACTGVLLRGFLMRGRADPGPEVLVSVALPLLVVPAGLLLVVSQLKPWYLDRYVLYGMAGLALLAGAALARLHDRRHRFTPAVRSVTAVLLTVVALSVLLPWSLALRSPGSRKDDVIAVSTAVEWNARDGDDVLFLPARRREWLLSSPSVYHRVHDLALDESPRASGTLQGTELPAATIRRRLLVAHRVIALTDPAGQPLDPFPREEVKRRTLRTYFVACARTRLHGAQVVVYARVSHCGGGR